MRKNKSWFLPVFLLLLFQLSYAQKSAYIADDSTVSIGLKLIESSPKNNAQYIKSKKKNEVVTYSPNDLREYGFKDGTIYISKDVSIAGSSKRVFLERLTHGKLTLYYYTEKGINTYFLQQDSSLLVEIPKEDFQRSIKEYTKDFDGVSKQIKLLRYRKKSLSKLVSMYNLDTYKPLPYPRFGITGGYRATALKVPSPGPLEQLEGISFSTHTSFSFGVFGDLPIAMSYFSVNLGIDFSKAGFTVSSQRSQREVDLLINTTSIHAPVLLRYTLPSFGWQPFLNIGGVYTYHFQNESELFESTRDGGVLIINEVLQEPLLSDNMLGYVAGIGIQRNIDIRKVASMEIRFSRFPGNASTLQKNLFDVLVSFSL